MKDNNDKKLVQKGLNLASEILHLTLDEQRKEINPEEYPEIAELYTTNIYRDELLDSLSEKTNYFHSNEQKMVNMERLLTDINKKKTKKYSLIKMIIEGTIAASIFLMISLWMDYNSEREQKVKICEMKPTLIRGNGESIDLTAEVNENRSRPYIIERSETNKISYNNQIGDVEYNTIVIPSMYVYDVILEDGTEVKLNANSELKYLTKFGTEKRTVYLKGEAYFKVAKSEIPFIVVTESADIRVYGTEFNVNLHKKGIFQTTLISGSVGITTKNLNDDKEIMIQPSQMYTLYLKNEKIEVENVEVNDCISWTTNFFKYDKSTLPILLDEISNWYGVKFDFKNEDLRLMTVTMTLSRGLPLEEIFEILENALDVKFIKINDKSYEIDKN